MRLPKNGQVTRFKEPIPLGVLDENKKIIIKLATKFSRETVNVDGIYTFTDGSMENNLRASAERSHNINFDLIPKSYHEFFKFILYHT